MDLWIDDGLQMAPDVPRRVGKEAIREGMMPGFDLFDMRNMIIQTEGGPDSGRPGLFPRHLHF